jgi:Protein of unknown function (DUF1036)
MTRRHQLIWVLSLLLCSTAAARAADDMPSSTDLYLCNSTALTIHAAVKIPQHFYQANGKPVYYDRFPYTEDESKGWWILHPNECQFVSHMAYLESLYATYGETEDRKITFAGRDPARELANADAPDCEALYGIKSEAQRLCNDRYMARGQNPTKGCVSAGDERFEYTDSPKLAVPPCTARGGRDVLYPSSG